MGGELAFAAPGAELLQCAVGTRFKELELSHSDNSLIECQVLRG